MLQIVSYVFKIICTGVTYILVAIDSYLDNFVGVQTVVETLVAVVETPVAVVETPVALVAAFQYLVGLALVFGCIDL